MKRMLCCGLLLCATMVPVAAAAQTPLAQTQVQRQSILELEYKLNIPPGVPDSIATELQNQALAIQSQINGPDLQPLSIPQYGGCAAEQAILSYTQDEVANGNLDQQSLYTYNRNIHDLQVDLKHRGC